MKLLHCYFVVLYLAIVSHCNDEAASHSHESSLISQPETQPPSTAQTESTKPQSPFPLSPFQSSHSSAANISHSFPTPSNIAQSGIISNPSAVSLAPADATSAQQTGVQQARQLSQHPSVSSYSDSSSESPTTSPQDPVFIPINEWKRRKLHDIELRVKKFQQAQHSSATYSSPDPEKTVLAQPFLIYSNPQCNSLVLFLRFQTCSLILEHASRHRLTAPASVTSVFSSDTSRTDALLKACVDEQLSSHQPSSEHPYSAASQVHWTADTSSGGPSAAPTEHQLLPSRYPVTEQKDELTVWIEIRSACVAQLQRVVEFFKTVKEMSAQVGIPPFLFNFPHQTAFSANGNLSRSPISLFSNGCNSHSEMPLWPQLNISNSSNQSGVDRPISTATITPTRNSEGHLASIEQFQQANANREKPYNFASVDSGARVLLSSKGTIGAKNILDNNVDKYLLVPCGEGDKSASRWVDIELSEEVILERLQTGNFEYYSSSPTKIIVLGSVTYPPTKWQLLGMFRFADVKTLQMFSIEKRVVTRYLRVLFVGKQGREYYCPISTVTAYGKTLIADWKDALNQQMPMRRVETSRNPSSHATTNSNQALKQKVENAFSEQPVTSQHITNDDSNIADYKSGSHENDINNLKQKSKESNSVHARESQTGARASQKGSSFTGERRSSPDLEASPVAEDARHSNQVSADTEDGISEEDQLVLEAVHADSLDQSSADDNVFRKVTRMLRLLELNQTLSNQYIDAQLAKFANVIQILQEKTELVHKERDMRSSELQEQVDSLRDAVAEIQYGNRLKSVAIVVLLFITCVLGMFLIAIRISNAATGALNTRRLVGGEHGVVMKDDSSGQELEESDGEQRRHNSRNRRRRKARRKRKNVFEGPMEGATETTHLNGSVTPTESSGRSTFTSFAGTL